MVLTYDIKNDIRYKEGKLEGKQEGTKEGIEITISVINLLNSKFTQKQIAENLKIPLEVIQKIINSLKK